LAITKLLPGQKDPVPAGTAIATFVDGKYPQNAKGHAAIYVGQNALGIQVLDQWDAKPSVSHRTIFWTHGSASNLVDNGKAYSVIEW
jgi:nitrous oxide reductase accessory protein NosL